MEAVALEEAEDGALTHARGSTLHFRRSSSQVYDVSKWKSHPGGRVMYTHAGQDATAVFSSFHAGTSYAELDQFYIGDCAEPVGVDNDFEREMRALVGEMHKRGLYNSRCVACCGGVRMRVRRVTRATESGTAVV